MDIFIDDLGTGSINQYVFSLALQKVGLDPRKDVQWVFNVPEPLPPESNR